MPADLRQLLSTRVGEVVSGEYLARRLGISRIAVWKQIRRLKAQGCRIAAMPNKGYMLEELPDGLDISALKKRLVVRGLAGFFGPIKHFPRIPSTQTLAKKLAAARTITSCVITADTQERSYGRRARPWYAPLGGLWFSLCIKPRLAPQQTALVTLVMSLAVADAVARVVRLRVSVKWPNDIYANSRKLCGILTEMSAEPGVTNWVVVGVGVNVNNDIPPRLAREAVALAALANRRCDRTALLEHILVAFHRRFQRFEREGFGAVRREYEQRMLWRGGRVCVSMAGRRTVSGILSGIDENGFLKLTRARGARMVVPSGDLSRVRVSGENTTRRS